MAKLKNWKPDDWEGDRIKKRPYHDRREYIENQKAAFHKRAKAIQRFHSDVKRFTKNFSEISGLTDKKILCLGARSGAEVKALRDLGNKAYGLDLEPVPNNYVQPYLFKGDFHDLSRFNDQEFDVVYTNSFDHAFNLEKALSEVHRILKDDGFFILEMVSGYEEGGCPGDHEAMYWRTCKDFAELVETYGFKRQLPIQQVPFVKGLPFRRAIYGKDTDLHRV